MQGPGFRQIYTVFYVITLCCCFTLNIQARTLSSLQSLNPRPVDTESAARLERSLINLENILLTMEANRRSADGVTGPEESDMDVSFRDDGSLLSDDFGLSSRSLSPISSSSSSSSSSLPSLEESSLLKRLVEGNATEKRGGRPCYWNVVSCYGK